MATRFRFQGEQIAHARLANLPHSGHFSQPLPSLRKISLDKNSGVTILNHMVKYSEAELDTTFAALSDVTRRGILARLVQGETSVSELAAPYKMSLPAVSKHLRVLEDAGLVTASQGRARASLQAGG